MSCSPAPLQAPDPRQEPQSPVESRVWGPWQRSAADAALLHAVKVWGLSPQPCGCTVLCPGTS